jgi:hypothetical protein
MKTSKEAHKGCLFDSDVRVWMGFSPSSQWYRDARHLGWHERMQDARSG